METKIGRATDFYDYSQLLEKNNKLKQEIVNLHRSIEVAYEKLHSYNVLEAENKKLKEKIEELVKVIENQTHINMRNNIKI